MAGQPRTRARRAAAAKAEAEKSASSSQGSRARGGARAAAKPAAKKPPAKRKPAAKGKGGGQRGPKRPRFEPASLIDFEAVAEAEAKALALQEKAEPLTPEERVARDEQVIALWAMGLTPATIGERIGLTGHRVGEIIREHRKRRARHPLPSSSELLHDMLDRIEALIERCSVLASTATTWVGTPDGAQEKPNDAVRLGAIRTLLELYTSQAGLWQAMGLVGQRPSDDVRAERARDLLRRLLDELRGLGVDQGQIDEAARRVLTPGAGEGVVVLEGRATG